MKHTFLEFTRALSVLLCALFVFYAFPAAAAEGWLADAVAESAEVGAGEATEAREGSEIVEITSLREERVKHFRLPGGNQYPGEAAFPGKGQRWVDNFP